MGTAIGGPLGFIVYAVWGSWSETEVPETLLSTLPGLLTYAVAFSHLPAWRDPG